METRRASAGVGMALEGDRSAGGSALEAHENIMSACFGLLVVRKR